MATLTEMVAAVVVHSSAAAFSHFGVTLETPRAEPPRIGVVVADQRTVARSPRQAPRAERVIRADCPDTPRATAAKA